MQAQTLRTFPVPQVSQRHALGIAFAVLLHVGLIYALMNGLAGAIIEVIKDPERITLVNIPPPARPAQPKPPKPTPTRVFTPPTSVPIPPQPTDTSITTTTEPQEVVPVPAPQPVRGVAGTHTIPPYPPISRRLGEVGIVGLRLVISETGAVRDVILLKSSGYQRLDQAALAWVKEHWRYHPATQNGQPVASAAEAQVKFELY